MPEKGRSPVYVASSFPNLNRDLTSFPILMSFLRREFKSIQRAFEGIWRMPILTAEPLKPVDGLLIFADGVAWDPGAGRGVYAYESGAWVKL